MSRSVLYDVSAAHKLKQEVASVTRDQQMMLDNDLVGILRLRNRTIVWYNKAMARIFLFADEQEMIGQSSRVLYSNEDDFEALGQAAYPQLKVGLQYRTQIQMRRHDGQEIWIDLSGGNLDEHSGESLWFFADITSVKLQQMAIEHAALHDPLTGLANRVLLKDRLDTAIAAAKRADAVVAVCYLDLDKFKPINDMHGHETGDVVLGQISCRLSDAVRSVDTVARIGGDEFVVLLTGLESVASAQPVLTRMMMEIEQPIALPSSVMATVSASMGVAYYPRDGQHADELLRFADQAMYRRKRSVADS